MSITAIVRKDEAEHRIYIDGPLGISRAGFRLCRDEQPGSDFPEKFTFDNAREANAAVNKLQTYLDKKEKEKDERKSK